MYPGPHSNACNFLPFLSIFSSFTSRTPNKNQKIEQFFYFFFHSGPITRRRPWTLQWTFLCMLFASAQKKSALRKKWYILVRLDRFPWFNHYSVALVLLYNNYETGTNYFHQAIPELQVRNSSTTVWCFCTFSLCMWGIWRLLLKIPSRWVFFFMVVSTVLAPVPEILFLKYRYIRYH